MEHAHQLLEQSARDGGCSDFGKAITHSHYHPVKQEKYMKKQTNAKTTCRVGRTSFSGSVFVVGVKPSSP